MDARSKTALFLIELQTVAARQPDSAAVIGTGFSLTFAQIDKLSDHIASRLVVLGVGRGSVVGLHLPRGIELIPALLGILKAGAAYLPLDTSFPPARLQLMAEDAEPGVIIGGSTLNPELSSLAEWLVVDGQEFPELLRQDCSPCGVAVGADDLAYVLYTSGSTGRPKGVAISHGALANQLTWLQRTFDFSVADRLLLKTPISFDASVWELFSPLYAGAQLVMASPSAHQDAAQLCREVEQFGVTTLQLVPSMLALVLDAGLKRCASLRRVFCGGEALKPTLCDVFFKQVNCELHNLYGPTEVTINATHWQCRPGDAEIPIGRPVLNTGAVLLGTNGLVAAVGEVGELYLTGPQLADGYWRSAAMTAERFLEVNVSGLERTRAYRTGDLAIVDADGVLYYRGRADQQLKFHGIRVEAGDIEAALERLGGIVQAVVTIVAHPVRGDELVAYLQAAAAPDVAAVREQLALSLPAALVPQHFVHLTELPRTPGGKVDRRNLPLPATAARPTLRNEYRPARTPEQRRVLAVWERLLGVSPIGLDDNFFEIGGNSLLAQQLVMAMRRELGATLSVVALFENPTVAKLSRFLDSAAAESAALAISDSDDSSGDIAIIGMAGRFPGARTIGELWQNLCNGIDSTSVFTDAELDPSVPTELRQDPHYVKARGLIPEAEFFDSGFFGMSGREADITDPQQRIFLETAWEAIEDAGIAPVPGARHGVFAGVGVNTYYMSNVVPALGVDAGGGEIQRVIATEKDYVAARVAFKLNLTGPALSVHTACSTSLVAVIQACNSLRRGECDVAIAGGASVNTPLKSGYLHLDEGALSPDGVTRPFSSDSAGTSFNSGAGAVVLKSLNAAQADGDRIYAVIRGVGINNDGGDKASFMAPSARGQSEAIRQAHRDAGISPETISYVEAHGTATPIGDPIEVEALTRAFAVSGASDQQFCGLGSIKGNVGHLVAAAGVAGLIKTALALTYRKIPPSAHYVRPNPRIDFANSPFYVVDQLKPWIAGDHPLRAGVSSFGVGGTNAHVVLEAAPAPASREDLTPEPQLFLMSARNSEQLDLTRHRLADHLEAQPDTRLADVAWTLQRGRSRFKHRQWVVIEAHQSAVPILREPPKSLSKVAAADGIERDVVFMFPGQGSQYVGMGAGLYNRFSPFREIVDYCLDRLLLLGCDLRSVWFPAAGVDLKLSAGLLRETRFTQPALFVLEYALARLWMDMGLRPAALVGHSIGEFSAAALAGVFSLDDGLLLVAERARLMQAQAPGTMLAVQASADGLLAQLPESCAVAAINGPELTVISGPTSELETLSLKWQKDGLQVRPLHTSHAFHSPMMDPVIEPFAEVLLRIELSPPAIPIMSTVDATWLTEKRATDRAYWARHLRETVQFAGGLRELLQGPPAIYLEVGPRNTATTLAAVQMRGGVRQPIVNSLGAQPVVGDSSAELSAFLAAAGELWLNGSQLDWKRLSAQNAAIVSLPTYPFARERHWIDAPVIAASENNPHLLSVEHNALLARLTTLTTSTSTCVASPALADLPTSNAPAVTGTSPMDQKTLLLDDIRTLFADSSGEDLSATPMNTSFLELGFDSLFLTQAALALKKRYRIDIPFRRLLSDLGDFESLGQAVLEQADPAVLPQAASAPVPVPAAVASVPVASAPQSFQPVLAMAGSGFGSSDLSGVQGLIQQQLQLMARQLEMLGGGVVSIPATSPVVATVAAPANPQPVTPAAPVVRVDPVADGADKPAAKPFGAQTRIDITAKDDFSAEQRTRYQQLADEYTQKTAKSKAFTDKTRPRLSDPRVVSGFKPLVKEITYPIVVERSKGTRLWDLDGNEYIDTLCGYGSMYFGYQPDWIVNALNEQLTRGMEIGPQHPLTAEVIDLLSEFLPHERYAFCNTGSEAVLGAIRMARTASGRGKIVMFTGDYHGIVDEVIVRGGRNLKSFPAAAGVMPESVQNMLVLEYGSDEALDIIRDHADDIAGVLVETVQSRHPALVPIEFLKKLRALTAEKEIALIFDEVITGFRVAPGGFQEYSGIQADICTYGKVIGGGISLGIIGGRAQYLDTLDGGAWHFGDDSKPEVGVTYFAGTFVRHPLALAAAKAVLLHLKQQGPALQEATNERAMRFARDLNLHFKRVNAPMEIEQFSSLMYFKFTEDLPFGELMFCDMRRQGIHAWYGRPIFVSSVHADEELAQIGSVFKRSLARMQEWGFIPGSSRDSQGRDLAPAVPGARLMVDADGNPGWFVVDEKSANGVRQVGAVFD